MDDLEAHDEIVRLEARIEDLNDRLENCRKFILAGRVAVAGGGLVLVALLFGILRFDPAVMAAAAAALLGGFIVWGSNRSTADEAGGEIAAAQARRAALIGAIELRLIEGGEVLH
jgi:hypothetical protein